MTGVTDLHSSKITTIFAHGGFVSVGWLSWLLEFGRQSNSVRFLVRQLQEKLYESLRVR